MNGVIQIWQVQPHHEELPASCLRQYSGNHHMKVGCERQAFQKDGNLERNSFRQVGCPPNFIILVHVWTYVSLVVSPKTYSPLFPCFLSSLVLFGLGSPRFLCLGGCVGWQNVRAPPVCLLGPCGWGCVGWHLGRPGVGRPCLCGLVSRSGYRSRPSAVRVPNPNHID
jgi:hypothetical protein